MPTVTAPDRAPARTYAGRSFDERDADRRERLLAAALELFGTEGYGRVPVERLCSTARVSTRHFYQRYQQKEDVLLDLYATLAGDSYAAVVAALEVHRGASVEVRLSAGLRAYLGPLFADPRAARVAFVEAIGVSLRMEAQRLELRNTIVGVLESEAAVSVARGEIPPRDYRFLALCLNGAITVVVHDWTLHPDPAASAAGLEDQLIDVARGLLLQL